MNHYCYQPMLGFEQLYTNNTTIKFYERIFSELDLSSIEEFPRHSDKPTRHQGRKPVSHHNLFRAFLVMKTQRFAFVTQLLDYLENNIAVAILCGFDAGKIPGKDVFYNFLQTVSQSALSDVMAALTRKAKKLRLVDFKNVIVDSTPIFANTKLNNPKSFVKNKFSKANRPTADSNCALGVHTASNDSNNKDYEFFWGYKDHILLDAKYGFPISNLTLPANTADVKAAESLILNAEIAIHLKGKTKNLIADKGYDSNPFYEFVKDTLKANVIAPLRSNAKTALFQGDIPICQAGLVMHKDGHVYRTSGIRFKFCCPYKSSKSKTCPCRHPNSFKKHAKNKGCIKWMCLKAANLRNSVDRDSIPFKALYSKRSSIERYNSRFKFLSNEQAFVRNLHSVSSIVMISHICLQLTAIAAAKNNSLDLVRSLAGLKKSA